LTNGFSAQGFVAQPAAVLAWSIRGAEFDSRRSQALADYLTALAQARQPDEALAVQVDYWTHLIDDYTTAASEAVAPFIPAANGGEGGPAPRM
jgi:hypothetical protein